MQTITKHFINGTFVESHASELMDLISPTTAQVIGHVTLGDEEDARRAIAAAKRHTMVALPAVLERQVRSRQLHGGTSEGTCS